jgi:hypothetical protein
MLYRITASFLNSLFKNLIFAIDSVADPDPNSDPYPSDPYVLASWILIRIH